MTPIQIAYFKHFLYDRGIQAVYISMYRRNRIKGSPSGDKNANPESLEQFLQEQPPFRVLMHAFYFNTNSDFGYDYWNGLNKKWKKYLELNDDNPQNDKVVVLKGTFGILRQNWDRADYWKTETMEATYARMHMEAPLKDVDLEKTLRIPRTIVMGDNWAKPERKFKVGDTIKGSISEEVLTITEIQSDCYKTNDGGIIDFDKEQYWEKTEGAAEEGSKTGSVLGGFSLVDTENYYGGGRKLANKVVSVNLRNKSYKITFAAKQSSELRKHCYKYVKLLTNADTKEIALMFNNSKGCKVTIKKDGNAERCNVVVNSKNIVEHICEFYSTGPQVDYFTLTITDTIYQNFDTIYKLKISE